MPVAYHRIKFFPRKGTKDVVNGMKEERYQGRAVTIKIRFSDFKTYTGAKTLSRHTDSEEEIRKAAFNCFSRFELKKKARLIGLRVSNLEKPSSPSS
jgi:nucleotidyltransferase/DNA polymerase involved in DNA repair